MLFKCYLDRSKGSGRGKIVSVTKAGLNDKYDAYNGAQSGLWDSTDQCKRTFYAVANLGVIYHALDSLIAYEDGLNPTEFTTASWATLAFEVLSAGSYSREWRVGSMPSGVYFYRLRTGDYSDTKSLVLMK